MPLLLRKWLTPTAPFYQQIADQLFVDVSTVNSHRKNMLAKYDVQNTAQLIKLAITNKLI